MQQKGGPYLFTLYYTLDGSSFTPELFSPRVGERCRD